MRILIGYDGSQCADAAIRDLLRAGLPARAESLVLSVADVFSPAIDEDVEKSLPEGTLRAQEYFEVEINKARDLAQKAKSQLALLFPLWDLRAEACADSAAWALIKRADEWKADLVVVGSHGHTALGGRLILGSVSQQVLYHSRSSVRVARGRERVDDLPLRIVIGTDGSVDAKTILDVVASRDWPKGSEARLVVVLDTVMFLAPDSSRPEVVKWFEVNRQADLEQLKTVFEGEADKLRKAGLSTSVILAKGNPKVTIVKEAESWNADSIFVGARGVRGIERLLLGSVSATVAARAHCSVEVVRSKSA